MLLVSVAHLAAEALPAAPAHVAIATEVGDFEGRHLPCDLPELGCEEDEGPGELQRCPRRDSYEERIRCCDSAEVAGKGTRAVPRVCRHYDARKI